MKKTIKTSVLVIGALLIGIVILLMVLFSKGDTDSKMENAEGFEETMASEEYMFPTEPENMPEETEPADVEEIQVLDVYAEGTFSFTVDQFRDFFADYIPEGYAWADEIYGNNLQNRKLQLAVQTDFGELTGIEISFGTKDADVLVKQMALAVSEDAFAEDVTAMSKWFVSTFAKDFTMSEQRVILEAFAHNISREAAECSVYTVGSLELMLSPGINDNKYYIIISIR